jgi:hypothetical protein
MDEVCLRLGTRREQEVRQDIGDDPVHLFGHRPIEAPQAGLDVGDRHLELGRDDGGRKGRIDVAVDDDERRSE